MSTKRGLIFTVGVTALTTIFLTNMARDIAYVQNNGKIMKKMEVVAGVLTKNLLYDIDINRLSDFAALGMTLSVDDPYTNYYSKEQFESYTTNLKNSYIGLGVVLGVDEGANKIVVVSPFENGPSAKAGILAGDYIVAVDGERFGVENFNDAVKKLRGFDLEEKKGTSAVLTIQRGNDREFDIRVERDGVSKNTVTSKMLEDGIAYLRISAFDSKDDDDKDSKDTFDEFSEHIDSLKKDNMKKLIIDLRDNPGGDLSVVAKIADILLPEGIITYTENKKGEKNTLYSRQEELGLPIAALVNGGSASASEVLVGALRDYEKAQIIGTKTFGKGIVQTVIPFSDGSGMSVTSAKYYSPKGICIHEIGIEPDILEELPVGIEKQISQLTSDEDTQLRKAIEVLK